MNVIELAKKCGAEIIEEDGDTAEIRFYPEITLQAFAEAIKRDLLDVGMEPAFHATDYIAQDYGIPKDSPLFTAEQMAHSRSEAVREAVSKQKESDTEYKCFHCGDTFITNTDAKLHFGEPHSTAEPACLIKSEKGLVKYIRQLEARLSRYQEEDSDVLRQMAEQRCERANAIEAAEVLGYERGLRAIRNQSEGE